MVEALQARSLHEVVAELVTELVSHHPATLTTPLSSPFPRRTSLPVGGWLA
jgi:hypothetical protein